MKKLFLITVAIASFQAIKPMEAISLSKEQIKRSAQRTLQTILQQETVTALDVERQLKAGASVNGQGDPLAIAIRNGHTEAASVLVRNGALAEASTLDPIWRNALKLACIKGNLHICQQLLDRYTHSLTQILPECLEIACKAGFLEIQELLRKNGAQLHTKPSTDKLRTLLDQEVVDLEDLKRLIDLMRIEYERNPNEFLSALDRDIQIHDFSCQAARKGHTEACKFLARQLKYYHYSRILIEAAKSGNEELCTYFISYGYKVINGAIEEEGNALGLTGNTGHLKVNVTPLKAACLGGHSSVVKLLLDNDAWVGWTVEYAKNEKPDKTISALSLAVWANHLPIVELLLKAGIPPNETTNKGWTPLYFAAHRGSADLCKLLIHYGAQVNIPVPPLLCAAENGHSEACEILLSHGADIFYSDFRRKTALELAAIAGHTETCRALIKNSLFIPDVTRGTAKNEVLNVLCCLRGKLPRDMNHIILTFIPDLYEALSKIVLNCIKEGMSYPTLFKPIAMRGITKLRIQQLKSLIEEMDTPRFTGDTTQLLAADTFEETFEEPLRITSAKLLNNGLEPQEYEVIIVPLRRNLFGRPDLVTIAKGSLGIILTAGIIWGIIKLYKMEKQIRQDSRKKLFALIDQENPPLEEIETFFDPALNPYIYACIITTETYPNGDSHFLRALKNGHGTICKALLQKGYHPTPEEIDLMDFAAKT